MNRRFTIKALFFLSALLAAGYFLSSPLLSGLGRWLVVDDTPVVSDAVVVLNSGVEYYSRLVEAATLYTIGWARHVVIDGNRKSDVLRELESQGFDPACAWYEDYFRILEIRGVPRTKVIAVSAEDVYDTITEAQAVGPEILKQGFSSIIVTTSKFHTRRARHIWQKAFGDSLKIITVAAKSDPFDPEGWWKEGQQVRWVLAEYGAWVYYWWQKISGKV